MVYRSIMGLNSGWKFSRKDYNVLPVENSHMDVYNFAKAGGALGPAAASYVDRGWQDVTIPHDWALEGDFDRTVSPSHGYRTKDVGWYRKCFCLEKQDMGSQILLEFDGIATWAQIYVNGSVLHRNWCGYTSFSVDITDRVFFDKPNVIAIRVDTTTWEGWWYEGAGIYREVRLVKKPPVHIAYNGIFDKPLKMDGCEWETQISVDVENSFDVVRACTVGVRLLDDNEVVVGEVDAAYEAAPFSKNTVQFTIQISNPRLWSLENPVRFRAVCQVITAGGTDEADVLYGYRTIRFDVEKGFFLNEKHVVIKGTCNHQDHAGIGVALTESILRYRLNLLHEMGSNAYRCSHGNPDPKLLDICDEIGMLVMDENRNFDSSPEGLQQLESMIKRDCNHPCVVMYSIFNEEPLQGTLQGKRMSKRMMAAVRKLDDTRPILGAMHGGFLEEDSSTDAYDVIGINYRPEMFPQVRERYPNHPLCGSEDNAALSTRGVYHTDLRKQVFSGLDEEKASWGQTAREMWSFVDQNEYVAGMFVWTGFDYRGEPTPLEWPSINSHFGILDTCGFPKDSYYLYQAFWKEKPIVHIAGDLNGSGQRAAVFSNCERIELWADGALVGKQDNRIYEQTYWEIDTGVKCLTAKGYTGDALIAEDTIYQSGAVHTLRLTPSSEKITGGILERVLINVEAVDKEGHLCSRAEDLVHFEVSAGLKIYGVGNGDPNSHEPDQAEQRSLWAGKCQVIVGCREGVMEDKLYVKAWADTAKPAILTLKRRETAEREEVPSVSEYYVNGWKMYVKLLDECPLVTGEVDDTDMNSYEPVEFQNRTQPIFTNQYGKYGVYRAVVNMDEIPDSRILRFYHVMGYIRVYLKDALLAEKDCRYGDWLAVDLPKESRGRQVLTVVMQCNNYDTQRAGICQPVVIQ